MCGDLVDFRSYTDSGNFVNSFSGIPLFGVLSHDEVAESYGNPLIYCLGGFILSSNVENSTHQALFALGMSEPL